MSTTTNAPKVGALFAGYGGLELAVSDVFPDAHPAWVAEFDAAPSRILAQRFPDVPNLGDVTAVDWAAVEPVDIITGGSPCQDLSHAGKRAGMRAGTRSGLWASMCDAIEIIRPRLVIWENVRGALSAAADSAVEPCPICVGDGSGVSLRALGRVLGDLAELGYDAAWTGVRAADVGAPHGRFRVFVLAWDAAGPAGLDGRSAPADTHGKAGRLEQPGIVTSRPPARTEPEAWGSAGRGGRAHPHPEQMSLLPTPAAMDTAGAMADRRSTSGYGPALRDITALLPTPAVNDMGASYDVERWEAWTARMKAEHGNGNGHGNSLHIEALRMLPTPTSTGHKASGASYAATDTHQVLPDLRSSDGAEEVRERATRGPGRVPPQGSLFAGLREHEGGSLEGHAPLAGEEASSGLVRGVRDGESPARAPHRPESGKQRPVEPADAVRIMPSAPPLAGGPVQAACGCAAWATYAPAIHRWEQVLGRQAPQPTEPTGKNGAHRLSARAVEFMMGLPDGWVTGTDTTRNEQLKALGNGVVPQQAAAAIRHLLGIREMALTQEIAA